MLLVKIDNKRYQMDKVYQTNMWCRGINILWPGLQDNHVNFVVEMCGD